MKRTWVEQDDKDKKKLKRASIPKNIAINEVDLEIAKKLLALPARRNSCKKKCHTIGVMSGKKLILTNKQGSMNNWDHFK